MKTSTSPSHKSAPANGGPFATHTANVATLRDAVDALFSGDIDKAIDLLKERRDSTIRPIAPKAPPAPKELESIAPAFVAAAADATVAYELYQDAWRSRQKELEAALEAFGPGPHLYQGEPYWIVKRTRNGVAATFLRRAR